MRQKKKLPSAFLEKYKKVLSNTEFKKFQEACTQPLKKSIRINTLKISVADFKKRAKRKKWKLTPVPWCKEGFWIDRPEEEQKSIPLGKTGEHILGLFYIQEASSMIPVAALFHNQPFDFAQGEENHQVILDLTAAPGSKTTQLAAIMKNTGCLIANEFSASRIKKLFSNVQRCGIRNTVLTHFDGNYFGRHTPETFDAILLDAPCTGEGTVRKDRDALKNWSEKRIHSAAKIQRRLLASAFTALKPGGVLVYSTCTLGREENEEVCGFLKEKFGDVVQFESLKNLFPGAEKCVTPEGFLRIWPQSFDTEGFFVARIRKAVRTLQCNVRTIQNRNFPFLPIPKSKFQEIQKYYADHFGFSFSQVGIDCNQSLYIRGREIWLFPKGVQDFIGKIHLDRIGIKLCEIHAKGIKTSHEMAVNFGGEFMKNTLELSASEAQEFYAGKDIKPTQPPLLREELFSSPFEKGGLRGISSGELLLTFNKFPLGIGKTQGQKIKNQLPRDVVREGVTF